MVSLHLGDRVAVNSVAINKEDIVVDMTTHGFNDPACCPSLKRAAISVNRKQPATFRMIKKAKEDPDRC